MPSWEDLTKEIELIKGVKEPLKTKILQLIQKKKALEVKNWLVVYQQYHLLPLVPYEDGNLSPGSEIFLG